MLSMTLLPQDEYRWIREDDNPSPKTFPTKKNIFPLYHQWRTYNADAPIIVNTYNTGTGKTKAALLRLLKRARDKGIAKLNPAHDNVLLIAPTNELILQHARDAKKFCEENDLPYRVMPLTREELDKHLQKEYFSEADVRRAKAFHDIINDPSQIDNDTTKQATIFVVNPDIFYYAIYQCYNPFDRGSLFHDFFGLPNYLIIDEFHYYDPKQLATFLFFIKLSQQRGYIDNTAENLRQFCILTATPRPEVKRYLEHLGLCIAWIEPNKPIPPEDLPFIEPVRALARLELKVYSTEELQMGESGKQAGGLSLLVTREHKDISKRLEQREEGAIISSSLATISRAYQQLLKTIPEDKMGRITGVEQRDQRGIAKERPLILATPTVDIGYNFERSLPKPRQNIDFLYCDAFAGDELIQRLGRAGRVLALKKEEDKNHPSIASAVISPEDYQLLKEIEYDGKSIERIELAKLALKMSRKNDLYAYIKTGSIVEIFHSVKILQQGENDQGKADMDAFLKALHQYFAGEEDAKRRPLNFKYLRALAYQFDSRQRAYGALRTILQEVFDKFPLVLGRRMSDDPSNFDDQQTVHCLKAIHKRLAEVPKQEISSLIGNAREASKWLRKDLKEYFKERARFSFRESFQPPLALIHDPHNLLSSKDVTTYSVLHIIRYYHADFDETLERWKERINQDSGNVDLKNVAVYCRLREMRDELLQVGLRLDATEYTKDGWEEEFAYQVTTLYGLEIVALNEHSGLKPAVQLSLSEQFVPAFVAS
ncbi:MAG TPA: type I-D CRISPR-associated helicase Cas3', partial [Ktedonobacteraceae bacterium]|nr:type I-D CRISPR-associated helicase Cas3' [Ktedonobacteraceae bacterium]